MAIPLALFYYLYLLFIVIFLLYTLFNLYILVRFGFLSIGVAVIMTVYLLGSAGIIAISWGFISQVDWQQMIPLTPNLPTTT